MNKLKIPKTIKKRAIKYKKGDSIQEYLSIQNPTEEFLRQGTTQDTTAIEEIRSKIAILSPKNAANKNPLKNKIKPISYRNLNNLKSKKRSLNQSLKTRRVNTPIKKGNITRNSRGGSTKRPW